MQLLRSTLWSPLAALALAACGGSSAPSSTTPPTSTDPEPPADPIVARVASYADAVCACTERACIDTTMSGFHDWIQEHDEEFQTAIRDPLRSARIEHHGDRSTACDEAVKRPAVPEGTEPDEAVLVQLEQIATTACECLDTVCFDKALEGADDISVPHQLGEDHQTRLEAAIAKVSACKQRLDGPTAPPRPPLPASVRAPVAADLTGYLKRVKGKSKGKLTATIETNLGAFHCVLTERETPITVANFVGLATGQKPWVDPDGVLQEGVPFYDGLRFHRVIPDFMIQGGDPMDDGSGGPGYSFGEEFAPTLRHDGAGVLSMANAGPGTSGSQFFITAKATPWLDDRHTVFGRCAEPELVGKITALSASGDRPRRPVIIRHVTIARR